MRKAKIFSIGYQVGCGSWLKFGAMSRLAANYYEPAIGEIIPRIVLDDWRRDELMDSR